MMKLLSPSSISFDQETHTYQLNGETFPKSYTALWGTTVEGFNSLKMARKKVLQETKERKKRKISLSNIWKESDWLRKWEYDAMIGTVVHKFLEQKLRNLLDRQEIKSCPEEIRNPLNRIWRNLTEMLREGWRIIGSEIILPDFQQFCCGSADLILQSTKDQKKFMIVDFKTTSSTLAEMRIPWSSKLSTLGVANSKLNSYCMQLYLYRNAFLKLLDFELFSQTQHHELSSTQDQSQNNQDSGVQVKVALCTPQEWIDLSTKEFEKFESLAKKLLRNHARIAHQIRTAKRFCHLDYFRDSSPVRFPEETDKDILYNMNYFCTRSPIFTGMKKIAPMLPFLPTFSEYDMQTLFRSDRFCSRQDGRTTETRAKTVLSGGEVTLRCCIDDGNDKISIYIAGTGTSSRGASKKHSMIVFTLYSTNLISVASRCDCILGGTKNCAHRCRLLLELRNLQFPQASIPKKGMDVIKRLRLFDNLQNRTSAEQSTDRENAKRQRRRESTSAN